MKRFEVHAGWMDNPVLIGVCNVEMARGNEVISFSYEEEWLEAYSGFFLDPDIYPMRGRQYPPADKKCFGFLSDIAPDRWGRKLMDRREAIEARERGKARRTLMESDYILGVNDVCRCGGLRLYDRDNGVYISDRSGFVVPPVEKLRDLENAALNIDNSTEEKKWLKNLIDPGSSLGGARPKANVVDENGDIWIAKFPSKNDPINIGAWEMAAHALAVRCGINVPQAEIVNLSEFGSTFLSKRFDRNKESRIHYASAMTMLGQTDNSNDDISYIDIAGVIEMISESPDEDLKELWKRMVFNICISNTDDHLRNHGFVLGVNGWRLSPAFDINPCIEKREMSLTILNDRRRDVSEAIKTADFFRLKTKEAIEESERIQETVYKYWRYEASRYRISKSEQDRIAEAFIAE